jgi:hypothetical protein
MGAQIMDIRAPPHFYGAVVTGSPPLLTETLIIPYRLGLTQYSASTTTSCRFSGFAVPCSNRCGETNAFCGFERDSKQDLALKALTFFRAIRARCITATFESNIARNGLRGKNHERDETRRELEGDAYSVQYRRLMVLAT